MEGFFFRNCMYLSVVLILLTKSVCCHSQDAIMDVYRITLFFTVFNMSDQGPKLTILSGCQRETEFFSVARWKNVVAKKCQ